MGDKKTKFIHQKIFFTFFGTYSLPRDILVITPISKIFSILENSFPIEEKTKGWWERAVLKINSSLVTLLKIPSGTNYIRDCLGVLDPKIIKGVIFLGYCTSFAKEITPGKFVIPTSSIFKKKEIKPFLPEEILLPKSKKYKIALCHRLLLANRRRKTKKIQLGDMETYFLYKFSNLKKIPALALLIVTDTPEFYPIYDLSHSQQKKIKLALKKLPRVLSQWIHKFNRLSYIKK
jgi:nucleoside phosphorylase